MRKIKHTARFLIFFLLLGCILAGLNPIFVQKDSIVFLKPFLDAPEEYDVLFLGDSQVYKGILPLDLYHQYGIASCSLASSNSLLSMSYWRMMLAFDYMTPKLIVLSVTDAEKSERAPVKGERLHTSLDGFPMSLTKARAILDLTRQEGEDMYGVPYSEIRKELFFPLQKYHSRWSSLTMEDVRPAYNAHRGVITDVHVSDPHAAFELAERDECLPEEGYGYVYLRKIIEECQRRGIPLVLYQPPYPAEPYNHKGSHTSANIAAEYGVPMLNFLDMNRVVDFYTDCSDPGSHLNFSGVEKVTDYLGRYLTDHFTLPDRREDPGYAHWNADWNAYVDEKIRVIAEDADSMRSRLMLLHDPDFNVVLTVRPGFDYDLYGIKRAMHNIAREHVYEHDDLVSGELETLPGLNDAADFNKGYMMIADRDTQSVYEFYGIGEDEYETSFGYVFCRMDGEWIDLSITQNDEETYYFDSWEEQDMDMHLILIDRRTGKPALVMPFNYAVSEEPAETEE